MMQSHVCCVLAFIFGQLELAASSPTR